MSLLKSTSLVLVGLLASLSTAKDTSAYSDAFIVESEVGNNVAGQSKFLSEVANRVSQLGTSCQASPRRTFNSPHFTGASFDLKCDSSLEQTQVLNAIQQTAGISKAWPVGFVRHQMALPGQGARAWAGSKRDVALDSSGTAKGSSVDTFSTHKMSNVDRLHNMNITGAGVKIAVLDGGFDTSVHGLSETKITYSVDITGEFPDANDNCLDHGTHVLGIVGAKSADNLYNVSGVAPDATFELYRIQKCENSFATTDDLIAGFTAAAERSVDIITCSYAGTGTFSEEPWSLAASRVAASGIYVSVPSGNDGPGPFSGGVPAVAPMVSGAGSVDNVVQPCLSTEGSFTVNGQTKSFSFTPGGQTNFPDTPLTVWAPQKKPVYGRPANCSVITENPPKDVANTITLVFGNECLVDSDGINIGHSPKYNLSYFIYYEENAPEGQKERCPTWTASSYNQTKGSLAATFSFAAEVLAELAKGNQVTVKIPSNPVANLSLTYQGSSSGGSVSYFSSWGPTWEGRTMPTYTAPGQDILSTLPKRMGSWGVMGGTSMATPYAAGVAALVKQQYPKLSNSQIQSILATTAQPVKFNDRQKTAYSGAIKDFYAPVIQQGGGLIDAYAASQTKTHLNVTNLSFNDTANRVPSTTVEISNTGTQELTYTLYHVGAASGYFLNTTGGAQYNLTGATGLAVYADMKIQPSSLTIAPGKTATVSVSVAADPKLPDGVSFFGGYIAINATGNGKQVDHLTLPYTGFGGNLVDLPMLNKNTESTYSGSYNLNTGIVKPDEAGRVYTCDYQPTADAPCNFADGLFPGMWATLVTGASRNMTISLINHKTGSTALLNDWDMDSSGMWGKANYWYWDGSDLNTTYVPAGDYFWRVKVLRLNGDVADAKAWDSLDLDTSYFTLKYTANSTLPKL
ncbi:uncharacterized protein PgNI_11866 [Pyricularia grisea]|uniref:Peptidase S8/S53 domain-containing protein n=1 Tax=Pyricularia grisea TaxID=148305 RepID=A0A6P8AN57_PYRGI|nr:uncharacterized protein PgNI_11866 [Pyricularia grisea]TLD03478.1 hypothetical protein PgNI_11866 [Pyricularia grisea]